MQFTRDVAIGCRRIVNPRTILFVAFFGHATVARAQATAAAAVVLGGVDKLLDRIETVNLYSGKRSGSPGKNVKWENSYGIEFGFDLGSAKWIRRNDTTTVRFEDQVTGVTVKKHVAVDTSIINKLVLIDSLGRRKYVNADSIGQAYATVDSGARHRLVAVDTELVKSREQIGPEKSVDFQLGLAYGQLDGLSASGPYELRGYVRELPSISLYATYHFLSVNSPVDVGVYLGTRVGIISLQDAQLFTKIDTAPLISISANTFETGFAGGLEFAIAKADRLHLTLEYSYMRRRFNSIAYNPVANLPSDIMHSLDLNGSSIDIGFTVTLPKAKK